MACYQICTQTEPQDVDAASDWLRGEPLAVGVDSQIDRRVPKLFLHVLQAYQGGVPRRHGDPSSRLRLLPSGWKDDVGQLPQGLFPMVEAEFEAVGAIDVLRRPTVIAEEPNTTPLQLG